VKRGPRTVGDERGIRIREQGSGIRNLIRFSALCLLVLSLSGCRPHDFPQYPANYREYAYVTNGGSDTVTVVDVVNVRVDRVVSVGHNPVAVAESPIRNEVYAVNSGAAGAQGSISVIDAEHNAVVATIALHKQPVSIDLDAAGTFAYAANSGSNSVSIVDLKARKEIAQVGAGEEPVAARVSPDGKSLVVANLRGNSVTVIDAASRSVRAVFNGCPGAGSVVILPDSSKAFVPCSTGHQVMVIALASAAAPKGTDLAQPDRLEALMDVGRAPVDLALKPDGGEIFVSNSLSDSVSEVYNTTDEVGDTYMIGADPVRGLVARDNALLYVANLHSQDLTVYSIDDGKRVGYVRVGDGPSALAFSTAGHLLFVVDRGSGDIAVVRTASQSLFTLLPAGRDPNAIAVKSFTVQ
jgi:YVTN family beta-propeller protein